MKQKVWLIDGEKLTIKEMAENVTSSYARSVMNDTEYAEFVQLQNEFFEKRIKEQEKFSETHYFPGCYGDSLDDC